MNIKEGQLVLELPDIEKLSIADRLLPRLARIKARTKGAYKWLSLESDVRAQVLAKKKAGGLQAFRVLDNATVYDGLHNRIWTVPSGSVIGAFARNAKKLRNSKS